MAFWKRFLLRMFVGALGGTLGVVMCGLLMLFLMPTPFGMMVFFALLFAMPFIGAFCAARAVAIMERFLDGYDPSTWKK